MDTLKLCIERFNALIGWHYHKQSGITRHHCYLRRTLYLFELHRVHPELRIIITVIKMIWPPVNCVNKVAFRHRMQQTIVCNHSLGYEVFLPGKHHYFHQFILVTIASSNMCQLGTGPMSNVQLTTVGGPRVTQDFKARTAAILLG